METDAVKKEGYTCDKGNYKGYYKMRPDSNSRLQYLSESWFRNKTCLDIGCNDGQFCIALAELYGPSFILGIDPDFVLIDSAKSRLKRLVYAHKASQTNLTKANDNNNKADIDENKVFKVPALRMNFLPRALAVKTPAAKRASTTGKSTQDPKMTTSMEVPSSIAMKSIAPPMGSSFPHNISFKARDIFDVSCVVNSQLAGRYDVVTCFSVSKWIHLNGGDAKLLEFFCRLFCLVHQGGRVVIEYQPWKSYENNKNTSDLTKANFPMILIRPELFEWILCDLVGFEVEYRLGTPLEQAKGFNRPILVLRRPVNVSTGSSIGGNSSNRKAWDNISSFEDLCNIVHKRIKRGTTTGPISVTTKTTSGDAPPVRDVNSKVSRKRGNAESAAGFSAGTEEQKKAKL